jgi:hypothetical protein
MLKDDIAEKPVPYENLKGAVQFKLHEIAELELIDEKE